MDAEFIKNYEPNKIFNITDMFESIANIFNNNINGQAKYSKDKRILTLITGGWSDNETIINAIFDNVFLMNSWYASYRGGKYVFHITNIKGV